MISQGIFSLFLLCTFQYGESAFNPMSMESIPPQLGALNGAASGIPNGQIPPALSMLLGIPRMGLESLNAALLQKQMMLNSINNVLGTGVDMFGRMMPGIVQMPLSLLSGILGQGAAFAESGKNMLGGFQKQPFGLPNAALAQGGVPFGGLASGLGVSPGILNGLHNAALSQGSMPGGLAAGLGTVNPGTLSGLPSAALSQGSMPLNGLAAGLGTGNAGTLNGVNTEAQGTSAGLPTSPIIPPTVPPTDSQVPAAATAEAVEVAAAATTPS